MSDERTREEKNRALLKKYGAPDISAFTNEAEEQNRLFKEAQERHEQRIKKEEERFELPE